MKRIFTIILVLLILNGCSQPNFSELDSKALQNPLSEIEYKDSFEKINFRFGKDKNNVYLLDNHEGFSFKRLPNADPETFQSYENFSTWGNVISKDNKTVYYNNQIIEEATPNNFEYINHHYSKDEKYIYFDGEPIPSLDRSSFELLKHGYIRDKDSIFWMGEKSNFDAETFEILDPLVVIIKDKNGVYVWEWENILEGIDPKSVEVLCSQDGHGYFHVLKDANGIYLNGEQIEPSRADTLCS